MNDKEIYEELDKINESLDELAREVKGESQNLDNLGESLNSSDSLDTKRETVVNEIKMPAVEDATAVEAKEEKEDKGGKGQIILIVILSVVLVALLASMIYFVSTL